MDIQNFIDEFKKTFIYDILCESLEDEQLFEHTIVGNQVIWMKEQTRQMWFMWQQAQKVAVPDGFVLVEKSKTEHWYLDEGEYMWMEEPDNWLCDMDIGEVQAVEHKEYLVTESNTLYAAKVWDDENGDVDTWQFFKSQNEAEKVAAYCKAKFWEEEAQEQAG